MGQIIRKGVTYCNGAGGGSGGASSWDDLEDKPFESVSADDFNIGDDKVLSLKTKGTNVDYTSSLDEDEGQVVGILTIDEDSKEVRVPIPNVEIMLEDYNKLSEEDKMKDIVYYIKDIPGTSSDISQSVALSVQGGEENALRFGYDTEKEVYGYYPPGADTLVPFKSGDSDYYTVLYQSDVDNYIPNGVAYYLGNLHSGGGSTANNFTLSKSYLYHSGSYEGVILFLSKIKGKKLNISIKLGYQSNTGTYGGQISVRLFKSLKNLKVAQIYNGNYNSTIADTKNEDLIYNKIEIHGTSVPSPYNNVSTLSIDIKDFGECYLALSATNFYTYIYKIWTEE